MFSRWMSEVPCSVSSNWHRAPLLDRVFAEVAPAAKCLDHHVCEKVNCKRSPAELWGSEVSASPR